MPPEHPYRRNPVPVVVLLALLAAAAGAQVPLESTAVFDAWAIEHSAHSPCSGGSFRHTAAEAPVFIVSGGPQMGYCLDMAWTLACTGDGLVYACELSGVPEWYEWGRFADVRCALGCRLEVSRPLLVTADRSIDAGVVALEGRHDVLLTAPDGTTFSIFPDSTVATASRILEPGAWHVAVDVVAVLADRNFMSYAGSVQVTWSTPVAGVGRSWGAVKSLYR